MGRGTTTLAHFEYFLDERMTICDLYCDEETDISKMTSYGCEGWSVVVRRGRRCDQSTELYRQCWDHVSKEEPRWKDLETCNKELGI